MVASALRSSIVVASLLGVATSSMGQDALDRYRTQMANMAPGQAIPSPANAGIAATIAQWKALGQTDALPFDSYAGFLTAHPGWPGEAGFRRAAERQAGGAAPGSVIAYFRRFPPTTPSGNIAYARALVAVGGVGDANGAVRQAWRSGGLSAADEAYVLANYPGVLTAEDHDARMDALLWAGAVGAAQRQLSFTSAARRPAFEARIALRTNSSAAATIAMGGEGSAAFFPNDPGFIADRATWLRNNNAGPTARAWLARSRTLTTRPADVEKWYEVLLTHAKGAAADRQWQLAYDIARQVDDAYPVGVDVAAQPYGERDDYTSLVWLAGQAAFKQLGRPADAMTLFDRYARGSRSPVVRSRGYYWAGRAAERAGRAPDAAAYFEQAAGYRDQFYGQLAAERLGRPLTAPPAMAGLSVDPVVRAAFNARDLVQAAQFAGQIGDRADQTAFIRQIASNATTASDHLLAADLSRTINRPDLAVMVGRSALTNGLSDYSAAGFPTVTVPAGFESNWTMIHAISRQESQFDRAAVSRAGARGLMQLMPGTAREQSGKIGLVYSMDSLTSDPNMSIMLGSSYFQRVYNQYGSYPLAIAAYNAGGGNVNKWLALNGDPRSGGVDMVDWIEAIPFQETRNYVQRVLENAVVYDLMNPARATSRGATRISWYLGKSRPG